MSLRFLALRVHVKVATWNLEWAKLTSWRSGPILRRLEAEAADVAVLTETQFGLARSAFPYVVDAGPHPRSGQPDGSKVVVASRHPLKFIDAIGSPHLPERNFVTVDTYVPEVGTIRVIGVVVRYSQKAEYINALPDVLARLVNPRTVLAGDFNLSMLTDTNLERQLADVLADVGLHVQTARQWPELAGKRPLIDHIALGSRFICHDVAVWPRLDQQRGKSMTDHAGAALEFGLP